MSTSPLVADSGVRSLPRYIAMPTSKKGFPCEPVFCTPTQCSCRETFTKINTMTSHPVCNLFSAHQSVRGVESSESILADEIVCADKGIQGIQSMQRNHDARAEQAICGD